MEICVIWPNFTCFSHSHPLSLETTNLFFVSVNSILVLLLILFLFLDFSWFHTVFVFFCLNNFSKYYTPITYPCCYKWQDSLLVCSFNFYFLKISIFQWLDNILFYVYAIFSLSIHLCLCPYLGILNNDTLYIGAQIPSRPWFHFFWINNQKWNCSVVW